jgi:hypothetical protein
MKKSRIKKMLQCEKMLDSVHIFLYIVKHENWGGLYPRDFRIGTMG